MDEIDEMDEILQQTSKDLRRALVSLGHVVR